MSTPRSRSRGSAAPPGPTLAHEQPFLADGARVAGLDEVGRGAWAGPLTVGAVILDPNDVPAGLRDSKRLTPDRRTVLAGMLTERAVVGIGEVEVDELDRLGLAAALRLAARRAVDALPVRPDAVLLDGTVDLLAGRGFVTRCLVGGDDRSASIAAASIAAKVHRDGRMVAAEMPYPPYGFARHKGYPSPAHRAALDEHGPCAFHRHSWRPIQALTTRQPVLPGTEPS
jgi:ribonuclease HII